VESTAPGDHHQSNPAPWAKPDQGQVARYAAQHVTDEENPGAQAIHRLAELQCIKHFQFGEADIDAVQVVEQVANEDKRDQTQGNALVHGVFVVIGSLNGSGAL
jgi:hypothetical protein